MKNFLRSFLQKVFGFKTYLFLFSLYCIERVRRGKYERELLYFISLIPDGGFVLDIGANIGITMVPLAQRLKNAEIHAFEPIHENFSNLERLVNRFKLANVKLYNTALGNDSGSLKMIMPLEGGSRMQGLSKVYKAGSNERGVIYDVAVEQLDNLYSGATDIRAIKIDVENFEYEVLSSAKVLLQTNRPLIYCELWDNEKRGLVFDFLKSLQYEAFIYNEQNSSLVSVSPESKCDGNNFFFISKN